MLKKAQPYLLNMILVTGIFITLAMIFQFAPFGSETMLTIDLGQQYIDFFSLFKQSLTETPEMLLYSFEKGIGGEMIGLWAYYLMSPFNVIFLFFNEENFEIAVTLITLLKVVATSLSFMFFARRKYHLKTVPALIFSLSYALMSYMMVYLLNIMWLDGLIALPLIALGLDYLLKGQGGLLYVISLAAVLMANYYIAYMICIFLAFYAIYQVVELQTTLNFKVSLQLYIRFVLNSLLAVMLSALTLLPTFVSLTKNKGSYLDLDDVYEIAHSLQDILAKFFVGSFNSDEMSSGSPNLYAGMFVLFFALLYFINRKIKLSEKIVALLMLLMFYVSFRYELLDKIWHGGQFPIWYHFRFSFTATFFLIIMAIKSFVNQPRSFPLFTLISLMTAITLFCAYYYWVAEYEFLSEMNIFFTLLFFLVILITIQLEFISVDVRHVILLGVVTIELTANATLILSEMNYVSQSKFEDYTSTLNEAVSDLRMSDDEFYRIHKSFMRTKNEAMYVHYNGLDHFGSTIEAHVPQLYGYLGLPDGNGFATYTNGTLFLDDFFSIRYLLDITEDTGAYTSDEQYLLHREGSDLDMAYYPIIQEEDRYRVHENTSPFGLGIEVSTEIMETEFFQHQPIRNQESLLQLIDYDGDNDSYYVKRAFEEVLYENVSVTDTGDGDYYTYEQTSDSGNDAARINWYFNTNSTNPYYFTLPSQFSSKKVSLALNEETYPFYSPFRRRQVINASYNLQSDQQVISVIMKEDTLQANLLELYEFNLPKYEQLKEKRTNNLFTVNDFAHNYIKGEIDIAQEEAYLLFTIPYDDAWQIKINGEEVETKSVLNDTLLAVPITEGNHEVELNFKPQSIAIGALTSLTGLSILLSVTYIDRKRKK